MGTRKLSVLAASALAAAALLAPTAASAAPVTSAAWPPDASGFVQWRGEGVNIRSCGSASCGVVGLGYSNHVAGYYCQSAANGFAHIWDDTTQVDGWVSTDWIYYGCD